ncbi:MAG TPA: helix-turn-helix domain-containing protein [Kofleriaceae bacterium]
MAKKQPPQETPLYVKLPTDAIDRLDRAAAALGVHKKDLVADLVTRYVDPDQIDAAPKRPALPTMMMGGPTMGTYWYQPNDPPEVLTPKEAGELLQIGERNLIELADAGQVPGRKLGPEWRFSRDALVKWLAGDKLQERK